MFFSLATGQYFSGNMPSLLNTWVGVHVIKDDGRTLQEQMQELQQVRAKTEEMLDVSIGTIQTELANLLEKLKVEIAELQQKIDEESRSK